jgi:uncharacterized OB-fold protein
LEVIRTQIGRRSEMSTPLWWQFKESQYNLVGEICDHCGSVIFPPRDVCPECEAPARTPYALSGHGKVYSYATAYHAPAPFEEYVPYVVALVKLEEGPLIAAQLTDVNPKNVEIGLPVEMVTRKRLENGEAGVIMYGYKFRPSMNR